MATRNSKGEGYNRPVRKNGRIIGFKLRLRIDGREIWGPTAATKSEASRLLLLKIESRRNRLEKGPTLSSSLESILETRLKAEWAPKTYRHLGLPVLKHVRNHPIGQLGLNEITPEDILAWRLSLCNTGCQPVSGAPLSPATLHRYQRVLERALQLLGHPVKAAKPKVRLPSIVILSKEQQRTLIERAVQPRTRLAILLMLNGLRAGEACGLKHEDRNGAGVRIQRQGSGPQLKTDASRAWVPFLFPELATLIGSSTGCQPVSESPNRQSGYVLATASGKPMAVSNLRRMLKSVAEGTDFENITPNELRHTAVVNLVSAGVEIPIVAAITRHSVDTCLRIYYREVPDAKTAAAAKFQAWLAS